MYGERTYAVKWYPGAWMFGGSECSGERDAVTAGGRSHGANRLVAGENGNPDFGRKIFQRDPHDAGARGAAMLHPDTTSCPT